MLRALLKRDEIDIGPVPARSPALGAGLRAKQRAKPFPIAHIYRAEPEANAQAEMLLSEIQTYMPEATGRFVPMRQLERFYGELCEREGWQPKHWSVIGRELGGLTKKVLKKRKGRRFMAYKIPRTQEPLTNWRGRACRYAWHPVTVSEK